jgi:hypothetical protein
MCIISTTLVKSTSYICILCHMTCESNVFCIWTCRMCMKDELVDLPALGCHVLLYYEQWTCYALFVVMEFVLCTYCDLLYMYLWSIMLNLWCIVYLFVLWCKYIVVMPLLLALLHIYWYCILCAGIPVNIAKTEKKLGHCRVLAHGKETICPLPCASTRQTCHASIACALLGSDLLMTGKSGARHSYAHGKMQHHGPQHTAHPWHTQAHDKAKHTAKLQWRLTANC